MAHDVKALESKVHELETKQKALFGDEWTVELIKILRRPGWTTPAEFAFFDASLDHILMMTKSIDQFKGAVLEASKQVEAK